MKVNQKKQSPIYVVVALVLVGIIFLVTRTESTIVVREDYIKISGFYGREIQGEEINSVSLEETIPKIVRRTNGIGLGSIQKGNFRLENIEKAKLYLHSKEGPYILIDTNKEVLIINYRDSEKTKGVYEEILSVLNQ